jgi:hypothetical protein
MQIAQEAGPSSEEGLTRESAVAALEEAKDLLLCGATLAAGASCAVSVIFSPTTVDAANGVLTVTDSTGKTYITSLNGTGVDFAISASPSSASVARGSSTTYKVNVLPVGGTFGSAVALTCSGLPAGSTCSFSPQNPVPGAGGTTETMSISTNQPSTSLGTFTITVTGTSGSLSHATQVQLTVTKPKAQLTGRFRWGPTSRRSWKDERWRAQDEAAVRALGDTFAKAFIEKNPGVRASLFVENGTFVTPVGDYLQGRRVLD